MKFKKGFLGQPVNVVYTFLIGVIAIVILLLLVQQWGGDSFSIASAIQGMLNWYGG